MLGPLFAVFAERIGGNILDITWAWATYLIVTGVLTVLVGELSDKHLSKEKLIVVGSFLNAAFTFCYLLVNEPADLFLVQAGLGFGTALSSPTWSALFLKYEKAERGGFLWGLASGGSQLTIGVAIVLGGVIVNYLSFTALFIIMGVLQLLAAEYLAQILKKD